MKFGKIFYAIGCSFLLSSTAMAGICEQAGNLTPQNIDEALSQTNLASPCINGNFGIFPLALAIGTGAEPAVIQKIIAAGADVKAGDTLGVPSLAYADRRGDKEIVSILLEAGADPTPLMAETKNPEILDLLIAHGGKISPDILMKKYRLGYDDVKMPTDPNEKALLERYIKAGADTSFLMNMIFQKSRYGLTVNSSEFLQWLVKNGADINAKFNQGNLQGVNILMAAPPVDYNTALYFMLKNGLNINDTDAKGNNILHYLVKQDNPKLIEFFVKKGVDINHKNIYGQTPLMVASFNRDLLLDLGADATAVDNDGKSVLLYHINNFDDRLFDAADLKAKDPDGHGVLYYILKQRPNNTEIVKKFVERGGDVNIDGPKLYNTLGDNVRLLLLKAGLASIDEGKSPIVEVLKSSNIPQADKKEIIAKMIKNGADVNARKVDWEAPIWLVNEDWDMLAFLKENGADLNVLNNREQTVLENYLSMNEAPSLDSVKKLLDIGFDMSYNGRHKNSYIMIALQSDNLKKDKKLQKEVIKLLAEAGADVLQKNSFGQTPLSLTANDAEMQEFVQDLQDEYSPEEGGNTAGRVVVSLLLLGGLGYYLMKNPKQKEMLIAWVKNFLKK